MVRKKQTTTNEAVKTPDFKADLSNGCVTVKFEITDGIAKFSLSGEENIKSVRELTELNKLITQILLNTQSIYEELRCQEPEDCCENEDYHVGPCYV